jgi:hypothetical protein
MTIFRLCFRANPSDKQLIRHSSSQRQLVSLPRFDLSTLRYFRGRALLVRWLIAQAEVGRGVEAVSGPTTVDVWTSKEFLLVVVILIGASRRITSKLLLVACLGVCVCVCVCETNGWFRRTLISVRVATTIQEISSTNFVDYDSDFG